MGLIAPAQSSDGQTIEASDVNNPINTIADLVNGNIDNDNIKTSAGIDASKLADGTITNAKLAVNSGWTSFTPNWTSTSGTPAIGNGTFTGQYCQVGKMVFIQLHFVGGSTTTWGAGAFFIDYPITPASKYNTTSGGWNMSGYAEDAGVVAYNVHSTRCYNSTKFQLIMYAPQTGAVGTWNYNAPHTWGTNDFIMCSGFYEAS